MNWLGREATQILNSIDVDQQYTGSIQSIRKSIQTWIKSNISLI